ncbi:Putative oxygenase [Sodalis praecaptivus]|uniref:Putative oxygenase n=1 Tax=Sodalis praecaptivus TaxID=1239307 RepID=W0HS71_9GAMM|nr:flavin reductase family protein [Sodalis praecaptivus]AHF76629.1 Putative oxygenase [Sodalis praecaptivus]
MSAAAEQPLPVFAPQALRHALGQFATGVTVVTAEQADGGLLGMTVSSFNTLSLDPPLILFSLGRHSTSGVALEAVGRYAVNILSREQASLSNQFARPGGDKWSGVGWRRGGYGAPLLAGALASFECQTHRLYDGGDHIILVGRVMAFHLDPGAMPPLIFFRGGYHYLEGEGSGRHEAKG